MKLSEILDDDDSYELMTKVLQKSGFHVAGTTIRNKHALWLALGKSFGGKKGRLQLKGDVWHFDIVSGQGHKVYQGTGTEEDALTFFHNFVIHYPVKESQDDDVPLVWLLVAKEKAKQKRVSIAAEVELKGMNFITGEIMQVDIPASQVHIYAYSRTWSLPMRAEDDERYTLVKDERSDFYWVKDLDHEAD
jgi:hypothetical protein